MAVNKPTGKTPTSESPRVPSTIPNDYDHLGVPGSVDMRLQSRRKRRQIRRRGMPDWLKAVVAMGTAVTAFGLVMAVIGIIAFPNIFRSLEPRYQQRMIDMAPGPMSGWLQSLRPTVPFDVLPTLGPSDSDAAQQLLLTPVDTPSAPTATPDEQSTPPPTPTGGSGDGIPIGMAITETPLPTPLPVYDTPTPAPLNPTWTPIVIPTSAPLPKSHRLSSIKYEQQGWNNCGPTTMTMALSYFGWRYGQEKAAAWMKPHAEDKNVSPNQMVGFVNTQNELPVKSLYRVGGNMNLLKRLLAANFPVVVEESIQPEGEGWMGHYVLLVGYDDYQQHFLTYDSFLGYNQGNGRPSPYSLFDEKWRHFNRVFMVVYEPSRELELRDALGDYVDPNYGYKVSLDTARDEASRKRDDAWAWFNMGSAYVAMGDYSNAAIAYDQALNIGLPFRMLWYQFGPYEAYWRIGDYNNVRALANNTASTTPYVEESFYWLGMADAAEGNSSAAIQNFNKALQYNRNFTQAQEAKSAVESGAFVAFRP